MRKGTAEARFGTVVFDLQALTALRQSGYKYVEIKGLTIDRHYEYIEPHFLMLIPFKHFPSGMTNKGIYESLESDLLTEWATEDNDFTEILIAKTA